MARTLRILVHLALLAVTAVMLTPMVWLICATFKHPDHTFSFTFLGPLYKEPDADTVFAWHFWNEFENADVENAPDAFRAAYPAAFREAWRIEAPAGAADRFLRENPGVYTPAFPSDFDREDADTVARFHAANTPAPPSADLARLFKKNFDARHDPNYIGTSMERPRAWFPTLSLFNFTNLFASIPFARYVINSFFITCAAVLIQLFFSSLGGFALAKYEFRGKRLIMILMLLTMMIPGQVLLAPLYELIYRMGLVDTYLGLLVPGAVSVFGMFLFRQTMMSLPGDLLEAGRVDGCSEFGLYWNIVLPVSRPMIGAFTLISFMGAWNSFLWPQIILHTHQRFTLPIGLSQMVGLYEGNQGALMAGTFLSVLPVVVLFFLLQKEFISGLTAGAVKA